MKLLTDPSLLPITAPTRGPTSSLEQIWKQTDAESFDQGAIEEEVLALSLHHGLGEIGEAGCADGEDPLLQRLNDVSVATGVPARPDGAEHERERSI